jgi:hypothetical protein
MPAADTNVGGGDGLTSADRWPASQDDRRSSPIAWTRPVAASAPSIDRTGAA